MHGFLLLEWIFNPGPLENQNKKKWALAKWPFGKTETGGGQTIFPLVWTTKAHGSILWFCKVGFFLGPPFPRCVVQNVKALLLNVFMFRCSGPSLKLKTPPKGLTMLCLLWYVSICRDPHKLKIFSPQQKLLPKDILKNGLGSCFPTCPYNASCQSNG